MRVVVGAARAPNHGRTAGVVLFAARFFAIDPILGRGGGAGGEGLRAIR
jgi:hypothetical protein